METRNGEEEHLNDNHGRTIKRPLYTVRQPPLIQPSRLSDFTQKTCSQLGIAAEDLAHEWVVLFQAISGEEGLQLRIPDTILLSPSGQPGVWYSTSSIGRIKSKGLMRVSPLAIIEALQTPIHPSVRANDIAAVRRLGFEVDNLSSRQLKMLCTDMESPDIRLPFDASPSSALTSNPIRPRMTKGVFCLQRYIPRQNDASFLVVWRHSPALPSVLQPCSIDSVPRALGCATRKGNDTGKRATPRAHSDVFLLVQAETDSERSWDENVHDSALKNIDESHQELSKSNHRLIYLDIDHPDSCKWRRLRHAGFDADVMAPLLFYMKRVSSEIANCINLGRDTRQVCGLACEFFVAEHNRRVYFSALRGIHWVSGVPSWELLRNVDTLSRSLSDFYQIAPDRDNRKKLGRTSPLKPHSPIAANRAMCYEQNPRFPSVHTPFAGERQWLHRSQLLAPDISPRYVGASVPKIYRDGVFQSLLTAHQADSVVRLNLSPQAPASLAEVRREQPHLSPRSISFRRKTARIISTAVV